MFLLIKSVVSSLSSRRRSLKDLSSTVKSLRSGIIEPKSAKLVVASDSVVMHSLIQSLTQMDSIVAYAQKAVSYKKNSFAASNL